MNSNEMVSKLLIASVPKAAWPIMLSAGLFCFYQFMLITIFNALNSHILIEFQLDATSLGHLSSIYFLSSIVSFVPAGLILDHYSTRKILLMAMSISVLCTFAFAAAQSIPMAMTARFVSGFSGAFSFIGCIRLATRWYSKRHLARVVGLVVAFGTLGGIVSQAPMTYLMDIVGWRWALFFMACTGVLMLLPMYRFILDSPSGEVAYDAAHQSASTLKGFLAIFITALRNGQNWLCGLYICLLNLPVFILGAMWGTLFLTQVHHLGRVQSSLVTSMIFVGMIIGSPTMGWLSDRWASRKKPMIIVALLSIAPMLMLTGSEILSFNSLLVIFFAMGFLISAQVIGYPLVAESNSSAITGTAESLASTLMIGGGLCQYLFGWLMDLEWGHNVANGVPIYSLTDYQHAIWILPIAGVLSVIMAILSRESNLNTPPIEQRLTADLANKP